MTGSTGSTGTTGTTGRRGQRGGADGSRPINPIAAWPSRSATAAAYSQSRFRAREDGSGLQAQGSKSTLHGSRLGRARRLVPSSLARRSSFLVQRSRWQALASASTAGAVRQRAAGISILHGTAQCRHGGRQDPGALLPASTSLSSSRRRARGCCREQSILWARN